MEYKYRIKCDAKNLDINYINTLCTKHNPKEILLEFSNTKNMNTSELNKLHPDIAIRIEDGYTDEIIAAKPYKDYFERSIYTRDEVIQIVNKLEDLEKGIQDDWNDIQKVTYIFDTLRRKIMYDHSKSKESKDIRSLRVLLSNEGVCAGYAIAFKDIMDRLDVNCEYVSGNGHAWNIVKIDGEIYPIDVTWGNGKYAKGINNNFDFLGQNKTQFNNQHIPDTKDPNNGYQPKLKTINKELIKKINDRNAIDKDYESSTFEYTRKDGTKFLLSQIGCQKIDGIDYYRYCYTEIDEENNKTAPIIVYSETNIMGLNQKKERGKKVPPNYEETIINVLFSRKNIFDSVYNKDTSFIGKVRKDRNDNKFELVKTEEEITKDPETCSKFKNQCKKYYRGQKYISPALTIQKMSDKPIEVEGINVYYYDVFEFVEENGKEVLKRNRIFTETDLFEIKNDEKLISSLLSRERLDRKSKETGGYIGQLLDDGRKLSNKKLVDYFKNPSGKGKTNSELLEMLNDKENISQFNSEVKYQR